MSEMGDDQVGHARQMNNCFVPGLDWTRLTYISWGGQQQGVEILCENLFLREEETGYVDSKDDFNSTGRMKCQLLSIKTFGF